MSDDEEEVHCFGCGGEISITMETFVTEPCPDVLGNIHSWHLQCYFCHKMHGAFPSMPRCEQESG